jgi:hypothetical protein
MKMLISSLLTALVASVASAQAPANQSGPEMEQGVFSEATRAGTDKWRSFFMFSASGRNYTIRSDGLGEWAPGKLRPRNFKLRLDYNGHIERVYYSEHEGDLLLIYEASNGLNGWGYVARLNQNTLKLKWLAPVNGFNIGPSLVEANYVYLTAASMIAKLDLRSGAYVWEQGGLHEKYAPSFQVFRPPWIKGDCVFFKDGESAKTIEVDKLTGKILNLRD